MSKKKLALVFILVLVFIIGGSFLWKSYKKFQIRKDLERLTDFYLIESLGQKMIESRNKDFSVIVPEGWRFRKELKVIAKGNLTDFKNFIGYVEIMSPELFEDTDGKKESNIFKSQRGCFVEVGILKEKMTLDEIKEASQHKEYLELESEDIYEFIEIDGHEALKNSLDSSLVGHYIGIAIPVNDNIYSLTIYSSKENQNKCTESFNDLLKTVKIK